ncbi:MAG: IS110 family transposase, partial [Actinomycetota bacterium]
NYAIHMFALVSYRRNEESRAYVQRKMSEGKSFKDAMRCLKRQLTNVIYRTMIADEELAVAA